MTDRDVNLYTFGDTWLDREQVHLIGRDGNIPKHLRDLIGASASRVALAGAEHVPARSMNGLEDLNDKLVPDAIDLAGLRAVKASIEIELLRQVCGMADAAAECFGTVALPGVEEVAIAGAIENAMRCAGASQFPRSTAVGAGVRTLDEYMFPTRNRVRAGDFVLIDCRRPRVRLFVGHQPDDRRGRRSHEYATPGAGDRRHDVRGSDRGSQARR